MHKCPWCNYENEKLTSLRIHSQKLHGRTSKELYDVLFSSHVCDCGCGVETKFCGIIVGYSKFCRGHQSRVSNNWGHNENAQKKSQDVRGKMWKNGEIIAWCKGKTKETDERLAMAGAKCSKTIRANSEEIQRRSQRMKENRLSGVIPSCRGADHHNWKGGVTILSAACHANYLLFTRWKFPKLVAANFKCSYCFSTKNLCVHHNIERMADIIRKFSRQFGYEGRVNQLHVKNKIAAAVAHYHIENSVSGIVLCEGCHKREHSSLNFK